MNGTHSSLENDNGVNTLAIVKTHRVDEMPRRGRRERSGTSGTSRATLLTVALLAADVFASTASASTSGRRGSASASSSGAPGPRPWTVERAELHGLSSNALEEASANVETVLSRDCFLVAKDGAIVHESYYGGAMDSNTKSVVDGVGSLALVAATGIAVAQGLFELDVPLSTYHIASAEEAFGEYADRVSARQLLAQTHGAGVREPGSAFTRDDPRSGVFLDIIGDLIESRSGIDLRKWAKVNLAEKIGAPEMFETSTRADGNEGASLWRDLRMSCRDAAKLGQLFVNKGKWLSVDGSTRQLFDPSFAVTALSVSYPKLNQAHGLMTWLHVPVSASGTECCTPRTTTTSCGLSAQAISGPILGKNAPHAPVAVSVGDEGSMIYMLPETGTVVVTLGRTAAGSPACPVAPSDVVTKDGNGRRDDAYLVRTLWEAMSGALKPIELDKSSSSSKDKHSSNKSAPNSERDWQRWESKKLKQGGSFDASKGDADGNILEAVRSAIVEAIGASTNRDDGVVHDGHASYDGDEHADEDDEDYSVRHRPTSFVIEPPQPSQGDLAEEEYKRRQIEYARDMQEREYKKFEEGVQRDYREALKATRSKYQKDMREAQKVTDAPTRASLEDVAAAEYLESVNEIEDTGKQSLEQLDAWRESTMPPLPEESAAISSPSTTKTSRGGSHRRFKEIGVQMDAVSEKMHRLVDKAKDKDADADFVKEEKSASHHAKKSRKLGGHDGEASLSLPLLGAAYRTQSTALRGSCVCGCPNTKTTQATCFDIDASALGSAEEASEACSAMHSRAGLGCPHTGIVQKCGDIIGKRGFVSEDLECHQVRRCPRTLDEAKKTAFLAAVFDCRPTKFASCEFVAEPCAHSSVVIKPVAAPVKRSAETIETTELARADAVDEDDEPSTRAAHRFPEHEHMHIHVDNAIARFFHESSAKVSVGLSIAILGLALITIASKWPTAVLSGDPWSNMTPFSPMKRGRSSMIPTTTRASASATKSEKAPLLPPRDKRRPDPKTLKKLYVDVDVTSGMESDSTDRLSSRMESGVDDVSQMDFVERFPRPIKVAQPQEGAFEEVLRPKVHVGEDSD
jgi:CubicO group peptidase (beta-lactamase class C family)